VAARSPSVEEAVVSGAGRTDATVRHGEVVTRVTVVATVRVDPNFRGTLILILILFGVGVVAQVVAAGTRDSNGIAWAWGSAVTMGVHTARGALPLRDAHGRARSG
jgi:hypothetical protein